MKKILLSVASLFVLSSSSFALDCDYLKTKESKFVKEDLACLTQELSPLMKQMLQPPVRIDDITSLVEIYESIPGKEITFYYQIDKEVRFDDTKLPSMKKDMAESLMELNCSNKEFIEMFEFGAHFRYSYNQLNKNLFDNVFTKETCDTYLKSKPVKAVVPVIENKVENVKTEEVKNEVIKENKIGDIKRIEIKPVPATK